MKGDVTGLLQKVCKMDDDMRDIVAIISLRAQANPSLRLEAWAALY